LLLQNGYPKLPQNFGAKIKKIVSTGFPLVLAAK
jgi:hypothetical protein